MEPTLKDFWYTLRDGKFYGCWNTPWEFGTQVDYCDGWHFVLHCGPFSVELS